MSDPPIGPAKSPASVAPAGLSVKRHSIIANVAPLLTSLRRDRPDLARRRAVTHANVRASDSRDAAIITSQMSLILLLYYMICGFPALLRERRRARDDYYFMIKGLALRSWLPRRRQALSGRS